jgi:hypothetical protein
MMDAWLCRPTRSTMGSGPVSVPTRSPADRILEKLSVRTTRPSTSRLSRLGVRAGEYCR